MDISALAALAGNALVSAAVTDAWEDVRRRAAQLFGRGKPDPLIEKRLDDTRAALQAAGPGGVDQVRAEQVASWAARLRVLLEDDPQAAVELYSLVRDIQARAGVAADHSVSAGRDVRTEASSGSVSAVVIHGDVTVGPTRPGQASR